MRSGKWTLHFPHGYRSLKGAPGKDGIPGPYQQRKTELALFDLESDLGQQKDVAKKFPEVTARLKALGEKFDQTLQANKRKPGSL